MDFNQCQGKAQNWASSQNLAGPIFSTLWLGHFFPLFGWANFAGQVLWLGHFWLGLRLAIDWPSQKFGPAKFFFSLAGPLFDWAKNGCDWPSQTGFSPTRVLDVYSVNDNFFQKRFLVTNHRVFSFCQKLIFPKKIITI